MLAAVYAYEIYRRPETVVPQRIATPVPTALLLKPIPDSILNAAELRRGQYLILASDCVACHTREGGIPFAGGYAVRLPFGVIYTQNLTSDRQTGIGNWTTEQFYNVLHNGRGAHGEFLYPALPYTYFTRLNRADSDAILAFLKTIPPQSYIPPPNDLPFPLNIRLSVLGWNLLFFTPGEFAPSPQKSPEWNRGAYLVTGPGHCGACHTPKNFLIADETSKPLYGGTLDNWVAPDLTSNTRVGLGLWSIENIVEYLKTGRNGYSSAGGAMAEVVSNSTSVMTNDDLHAVAVYLKDQSGSPDNTFDTPDAGAMKRGAAVYFDICTSCHMEQPSEQQARLFPPMRANMVLQQSDPTGLLHLILAGDRTAPTPTRPSGLSMPSFAWKLNDQQIADLATYARNSWGNKASPVEAYQVSDMRKILNLESTRTSSVSQ